MKSLRTACMTVIITGLSITFCAQPKEDSATKDAVEDMTGRTTVKQGEMMKKKLEAIEKSAREREKELEAVK